jgi:hypothetical protein
MNNLRFKGALTAASKGRTTLVIAHRLSTIVDADRVSKDIVHLNVILILFMLSFPDFGVEEWRDNW